MLDWNEYLTLARDLASRPDNEAAQRSAISRAYDAAYGRTAESLIEREDLVRGSITHHAVWLAFRDAADPDRFAFWEHGTVLKDRREHADYRRLFQGSLTQAARDSIRRATEVLTLLDRL